MPTGTSDFLKYNLWANQQLLDACSGLTDAQLDFTSMDGVYGNIRDTILHILGAEEWYVYLLTGQFPATRLKELTELPSFDELRRRADQTGNAMITVAEKDKLDRVIEMDEGTYHVTVVHLLIQVVNHGIDHRSQISTLLTQQSIEPPELSGWSYNDATQ